MTYIGEVVDLSAVVSGANIAVAVIYLTPNSLLEDQVDTISLQLGDSNIDRGGKRRDCRQE